MRSLFLGLTAFASLAGAALAQAPAGSSASLQTAVGQPSRVMLDGQQWRCAGQACVASGQPRSQSVLRACQRAVAQLGPVTAFTYAGRTLPAEDLPRCNAQARDLQLVEAR